ncbi:hypothetical protein [Halorarius litoreus]|nr:hypothetical protein [Halorarius litoreus]
MREQASLYSDDADRFAWYREQVAERRNGVEPSNSELLRLMMDQFDPSQV